MLGAPAAAYAQAPAPGGDIFQNITQLLCTIANSLSGPLALAIGLAVIAGGGIALAIGGRRAMGTIIWGLVGVAVAIGAATIVNAAFGQSACQGR
jgi:type IV secretory pathway VirB2 component (pilin)